MAYSVPSAPWRVQMGRPKPTEKRSTRTPESPRHPEMAELVHGHEDAHRNHERRDRADEVHRESHRPIPPPCFLQPTRAAAISPRRPVFVENRVQGVRIPGNGPAERLFHYPGDGVERRAAVQERRHRHFVGRVEHRRQGAPGAGGLVAEAKARRPAEVRRLEIEPEGPREIEAGHPGVDALGPGKRVGDGGTHIRRAELGENRPVLVFHHRMHGALGVDDDLDTVRDRLEQPARLDDLERLVHHGSRVDRDLRTHLPVRMGAGRLGGHGPEVLGRPMAKRTAGSGEENPPHAGPRRARRKALEDGVVLAVDGNELGSALAYRIHEEPPRHDQCFLVREQDPLFPARAAARVGSSPAAPTIPASTCRTWGRTTTSSRADAPASTLIPVSRSRPRSSPADASSASTANSGRCSRH